MRLAILLSAGTLIFALVGCSNESKVVSDSVAGKSKSSRKPTRADIQQVKDEGESNLPVVHSMREEYINPIPSLRFRELQDEVSNDIPDPWPKKIAEENLFCDVSRLTLEGVPSSVRFQTDKLIQGGSYGVRVFPSRDMVDGHLLVAKTVRLDYKTRVLDVLKEKAVLLSLPPGIAPRVYIPRGLSPLCSLGLIVMENVGSKMIKDAIAILIKNRWELVRSAVRGLELLRNLHDQGFVHGDLHGGNIIYSDEGSISETLRLIDFERAEVFVTPGGLHVEETRKEYCNGFSAEALSPFELDGWLKTRRDDIFRLAEMLIEPFVENSFPEWEGSMSIEENRERYSKFKKERELSNRIPPVFRDFYRYSLNLGFSERPDYEYWSIRFLSEYSNDF